MKKVASETGSRHFERAKAFIETCIAQQELFYLGWPTVMSYLRIATQTSVFDHPLSPDEAMANIETLLSLPHARFLPEGEGFCLRYHGVRRLYTHDRDFLKFAFLGVRDPFAGRP